MSLNCVIKNDIPGRYLPLDESVEAIAKQVVDASFKIHSVLGPGLLESVYEECLCYELSQRGLPFKRQLSLPIVYEGVRLETGLRLDLLVADTLIVELKAVEQMLPLHHAQVLIYLMLTGIRLGLIINFNVPLIKDGIRRVVREALQRCQMSSPGLR